jgi:hypothetical protein
MEGEDQPVSAVSSLSPAKPPDPSHETAGTTDAASGQPKRSGLDAGARDVKEPSLSAGFHRKEPGCGGRIRTADLRVMSPTSCRCSTPRGKCRDAPRGRQT